MCCALKWTKIKTLLIVHLIEKWKIELSQNFGFKLMILGKINIDLFLYVFAFFYESIYAIWTIKKFDVLIIYDKRRWEIISFSKKLLESFHFNSNGIFINSIMSELSIINSESIFFLLNRDKSLTEKKRCVEIFCLKIWLSNLKWKTHLWWFLLPLFL